jgi:hypothetical protein
MRGGEVDALHLAAAERAALPVQGQVANTHVVEVLEPGADLVKQQLERFALTVVTGSDRDLYRASRCPFMASTCIKEAAQPVHGQQHQIVQAQAWQGFQLITRPFDAGGMNRLAGGNTASACALSPTRQSRLSVFRRAPMQSGHSV